MSSLTKPQLFTKGEGCKKPTMPYMAIVTSMDKALTKYTHRTCDDQQDHTRVKMNVYNHYESQIYQVKAKLLQQKSTME